MSKIVSYIGFAIKARKIVVGQSSLKTEKKKIHLILVCPTASENLKNLANNLAIKHGCKTFCPASNLDELSHMNGVKIMGITDENLANAILKEGENNIG